ncbi:MAG TPA: phage tail tube protein [Bacillota bacterium]|nr:phage tail tube protein [Bacillota bacterium]
MATPKAQMTSLMHLGLGIEATLGTPVAPTAWVPSQAPKPQVDITYVADEGFRGVPWQTFGEYQGTMSSTYQMDGMFYPLSGGNLLAAFLGLDTVTGATPYLHTFTAADTTPSYTLSDTVLGSAAVGRKFAGSRLSKLKLNFTPKGGLSYTANWLGWPDVTYTPEATTFETEPFFLGWEAALSFGGSPDLNLSKFQLQLERVGSEALFSASGTQNPYDIFVGPIKVTWDLSFYMITAGEYDYPYTQTPEVTQVVVTQPATGAILTLVSSGLQFTKPTIGRGSKYVTVALMGTGYYNATDSGALQAMLSNTVTTSYSTTAAS